MAVSLHVLGAGAGGFTEVTWADDDVTFALCRVPVGSELCAGMRRARTNARKGDIKKALGEVHAELSFSDTSEITFDAVMEQLAKVFAGVDSSGGSSDGTSVSKLKADYEEMLRNSGVLPVAKPATTVALTRKTARELGGPFNPPDVLAAVREPMGQFNWALFRPSADPVALDFGNAGSLSVPELAKWLRDDEVLCGLMRLGFGVGRFRRVKWVYMTWSGPSVGAVKRAKAMSSRAAMRAKLGTVSVEMEVTAREDLTLDQVIDKVRRAAVVDGDEVESTSSDAYSLAAFMEALQEEASASAEYFGDAGLVLQEEVAAPPAPEVPWVERPAADVIAELRKPKAEINWAAFVLAS